MHAWCFGCSTTVIVCASREKRTNTCGHCVLVNSRSAGLRLSLRTSKDCGSPSWTETACPTPGSEYSRSALSGPMSAIKITIDPLPKRQVGAGIANGGSACCNTGAHLYLPNQWFRHVGPKHCIVLL